MALRVRDGSPAIGIVVAERRRVTQGIDGILQTAGLIPDIRGGFVLGIDDIYNSVGRIINRSRPKTGRQGIQCRTDNRYGPAVVVVDGCDTQPQGRDGFDLSIGLVIRLEIRAAARRDDRRQSSGSVIVAGGCFSRRIGDSLHTICIVECRRGDPSDGINHIDDSTGSIVNRGGNFIVANRHRLDAVCFVVSGCDTV